MNMRVWRNGSRTGLKIPGTWSVWVRLPPPALWLWQSWLMRRIVVPKFVGSNPIGHLFNMGVCWNWQTGSTKNAVSQGVWVRVPSLPLDRQGHIWSYPSLQYKSKAALRKTFISKSAMQKLTEDINGVNNLPLPFRKGESWKDMEAE